MLQLFVFLRIVKWILRFRIASLNWCAVTFDEITKIWRNHKMKYT